MSYYPLPYPIIAVLTLRYPILLYVTSPDLILPESESDGFLPEMHL